MKKLVVILVLVLVATPLLLPPVLGGMAKSSFETTLARSAAQSAGVMDLTIENYDRGWFSSRADLRINFTDAYLQANPAFVSPEPGIIKLRDALAHGVTQRVDIAHGPLILGETSSLGLGEIASEFDGGNSKPLQAFLARTGNPYFIKTRSLIGFSGSGPFSVEMPAFDIASPWAEVDRMVFAGLRGAGTMDYRDTHVVAEGTMGGFSLESEAADIVMEKTTFAVDIASPASAPYGIGSGRITIDALTAILGETFALDVNEIGIDFTSTQNDNGNATVAVRYLVNKVQMDQSTIADIEFAVKMRNLNTDAYMQLQQANLNGSSQQTQSPDAFIGPVYDLLKDGAGLSLDPIAFTYDNQIFKASLDVDTKPANLPARAAFSFDNPLLFINLFKLDLTVLIDKNLAATLAVPQLKQQLAAGVPEGTEIDDAQLQQMAEAQAPVMLGALVGQGMLKDDGKNYSVKAQYDNGAMTVNGQPLPIAQMLNGSAAR